MDRVLYQCGCEEWWPLCNLYFCRHCSILRYGIDNKSSRRVMPSNVFNVPMVNKGLGHTRSAIKYKLAS
ncbi:hypothetical protein TELCIR_21328, partial [Teladorsagia circumcincta]